MPRRSAHQCGIVGFERGGRRITKHLVEAMGGTIGVASNVPAGAGTAVEASDARLASRVILCIEDNLANLKLIQLLLARQPEVKLIPAMEGATGLQLAVEHRPGLILLDMQLPDLSGYDVLRRLKERVETKEIPVVMISADASPHRAEWLREAGAWRYLTKPLDLKQFQAVVAEALHL
jgi:CheY-like chemotaxis protein